MINAARAWLSRRLGLSEKPAKDGSWWEIDLILVIFGGSILLGLLAVMTN